MALATPPSSSSKCFLKPRVHILFSNSSSRLSLAPLALSNSTVNPVNWDFSSWAIVTTAPARSTPHFDAGGYATWLEVIVGTKLFLIRDDVDENTTGEPTAEHPLDHTWTPVLLRPGHKL
jgi:hypothetical protein